MQTIGPPTPWFELETFCTKMRGFIALTIIMIIIETNGDRLYKQKFPS